MNRITYEQPLNERVRTLLRLEFLFLQIDYSLDGQSAWDSRATISGLIEIFNIFSRTDLKTEILKELERLSANLTKLEQTPGVNGELLSRLLDDIDQNIDRLHATQGQIAQSVRDNEFLNSIKQRSSIPGGTCDFDLPAYHYWLEQPAEPRIRNLRHWLSAFDSFRSATHLVLKLMRESADSTEQLARGGFYQQSLDTATPFQLIRVILPHDSQVFAEISGGKHRFTIRFMKMQIDGRPIQTDTDIPFTLSCCAI